MRRCMAVAIVSLSILVPARQAVSRAYGWTLSASGTNPHDNYAPFLPGVQVYSLWLACCLPEPGPGGMSSAEFSLRADDPANVILGFTPMNGFSNAGSESDLLLSAPDCPCGPVVAGELIVLSSTPGQYCFVPSPGGVLGTFDCTVEPTFWPIEQVGLSTDAQEPCHDGLATCLQNTSVEDPPRNRPSSWGRVKSLYRALRP